MRDRNSNEHRLGNIFPLVTLPALLILISLFQWVKRSARISVYSQNSAGSSSLKSHSFWLKGIGSSIPPRKPGSHSFWEAVKTWGGIDWLICDISKVIHLTVVEEGLPSMSYSSAHSNSGGILIQLSLAWLFQLHLPCEAHWTTTEYPFWDYTVKEKEGCLPFLIVPGSEISNTSAHPSAVCCPAMGSKHACLCAMEADFVLNFLSRLLPPLV